MRRIKIFAINTFICVLILEAALFSYYSFKNGGPVSATALFRRGFVVDSLDENGCSWGEGIGPHPYLAVYYPARHDECSEPARNNYGLRGRDIPLQHDPRFFTVLVIGASVAEQIAVFDKIQQHNDLENYLNSRWISPTGRPFRVLNGAVAGAHQPITAIQALLFLPIADQIISLEGYNEHFRLAGDELIEQPTQAWLDMAVSLEHPLAAYFLYEIMHTVRGIKKSFWRNSYTLYALTSEPVAYLQAGIMESEEHVLPFPPPDETLDAADRSHYYLRRYLYYAEQVQALAAHQKKPFTLFIQPSPHFYKQLTPEEVLSVGNISGQEAYAPVIAALKSLNSRGIHVESLEKIFADVKETLYVDHIHTNNEGLRIMSREIAERLAKKYGWKIKQRSSF